MCNTVTAKTCRSFRDSKQRDRLGGKAAVGVALNLRDEASEDCGRWGTIHGTALVKIFRRKVPGSRQRH
jgi:hypothetical protein